MGHVTLRENSLVTMETSDPGHGPINVVT